MKITIWLTADNGKILSKGLTQLDKNFNWETKHIPNVGDNVTIDLEHLSHLLWADEIGWIDGKVLERNFQAGKDEVELTLEIERTVAKVLSEVTTEAA